MLSADFFQISEREFDIREHLCKANFLALHKCSLILASYEQKIIIMREGGEDEKTFSYSPTE